MQPRKPAHHTVKQLFHACIALYPFSKVHHFCIIAVCQVGQVTQKILLNLQQPFVRYGRSKFHLYLFFLLIMQYEGYWGASIYFHTLCKNCYKTQTCNSIASIFGTNEEQDSYIKFAVNLRDIQGVMSIYSH